MIPRYMGLVKGVNLGR